MNKYTEEDYKRARNEIVDLRSAIEFLSNFDNQLLATDVEVDPVGELSGVYRHIGAAGTTMRPTQEGPMMLFNKVKGFTQSPVAIGVFSSRARTALLLGCQPEKLGHVMADAVNKPVKPIVVEQAPCQEVVYSADDPEFDIRKIIPAPTNTIDDAGPYVTLGLVYAEDPVTGESDVTIHRQCFQSRDEVSIFFAPGRHIDAFREKAEAMGKALPVTINIGLDPAVYVSACFEPPVTPLGFNELEIAGAFRNKAIELVKAKSVDSKAIAHAEIVIEGEIMPNYRVAEDQHTKTGKAMPEFPGYTGDANQSLPVIKVKSVTTRINPITQTCIGCSEEHVSLAGICTEASILTMTDRAMPGRVLNVYAHSSGGGKLMAIMQFKKLSDKDEGRQRQAALVAFAAFPELKNIILVDDDVDLFDSNDVLWALNTRHQADVDTIVIPGVSTHVLDPSQMPDMSPSIKQRGISCKTIYDCTVPLALKNTRFARSQFMDVDYQRFLVK